MKKNTVLSLVAAAFSMVAQAQQVTFENMGGKVLTERPEASTGLNALFVAPMVGTTSRMVYTPLSTQATVTVSRYSTLGGGYAEAAPGTLTREGSQWTLSGVEGDMGYIIEEDGVARYYMWLVDYSRHEFNIESLTPGPEQECDITTLIPTGTGDHIYFYTINGRREELSRGLSLTYTTLQYDEGAQTYATAQAEEILAYLPSAIHCTAPLCDTRFTLEGDRFQQQWGRSAVAQSPLYTTHSVAVETQAVVNERDADNEQSTGADGGDILGGSAPVEIKFTAQVTDAVVFNEWQFSTYPEFDDIYIRMNQPEVEYTFLEQGTMYVRFMASNAEGSCDVYGPVYTVFVGDSALQCPNAFSPGASEGVNDIWKVSYKSIIEFECHIFNKWGTELASFRDPSGGWDGKYNGKVVPAGVYYYVIQAKGADGKKYKLSGDINVVNYK